MLNEELRKKGERAKEAAFLLSTLSTEKKNQALSKMASALEEQQPKILAANEIIWRRLKRKGWGKPY